MEREGQEPPEVKRKPSFPDYGVYIADLASYNAGYLHGVWLDATTELEEQYAAVNAMMAKSPVSDAAEWLVHDFDGFPGNLPSLIGETSDLEMVQKVADGLALYGEPFGMLIDILGIEQVDEARDHFNDYYRGSYESLRAYAEQMWDELDYQRYIDELPEHVAMYVTVAYDDFGAALTIDGEVYYDDAGKMHIFETTR